MNGGAAFRVGLMALCLAGCDGLDLFNTAPPVEPAPRPAPLEPTEASLATAQYFGRVEQGHVTRGLLRGDGGGVDTPFDADDLAREFLTIAFQREFSDAGASLAQRREASRLHRWEEPVRIEPVFGATVGAEQRTRDEEAIRGFARRLARASNHPVSTVPQNGNFRVLIVSEDQRRALGTELRRLLPGIRDREVQAVERLERATYCVVLTSAPGNDGILTNAVAVIRAELPPLLRLSCIHEELAQGMGLPNDSDSARPSIFNDDDEFGRLTVMDEMMLGMLYSLRLTPGMDAETAKPIVKALADAQFAEAS